ncbi:MAG: hypothetical protein ACRC6M_08280 [Microcystaceae cyanobacterium]
MTLLPQWSKIPSAVGQCAIAEGSGSSLYQAIALQYSETRNCNQAVNILYRQR